MDEVRQPALAAADVAAGVAALPGPIPVAGSTEGVCPFLPPEAPLAMPEQSLRAAPGGAPRPASAPRAMALRRALVIGGAVVMTGFAGREMFRAMSVHGTTPLQFALIALFVGLFAWIALAFTSALAGFASLIGGGGRRLGIDDGAALPELASRTALLMPCYNEAPARLRAALQAMCESLVATGRAARFDVFILSDTTDAGTWIAEEAAYLALRGAVGDPIRIFYRRRPRNTDRKAGNVADWVTHWGGAYDHMLVLDADSVMDGAAIVRLAAAMESHSDVGLIQTFPVIVNATTPFARMQQFAGRVYGLLIAHGIAWWHGAEGNYWGHNAIIRTRAFADAAGLPHLRGRKPFGGHILSHDFVEAALLRRAGWAVHMVPALPGSYEESPPSLADLAARDRRWCQGNLQHAAVLPGRGLHWVSRLHMLMGIGSYLTAPMWLGFLVLGVMVSVQAAFTPPRYFSDQPSLFPVWPVQDPVRSMWLFVATMGVLLAPKLLSFAALLADGRERRGCGGTLRAVAGLLLETVLASLLAPLAMLIQTGSVAGVLGGRDTGWRVQRRGDGSLPFRDVARAYWGHTVFGLALGAVAWAVSPGLALWMSPVVVGLALSVPLAWATASMRLGRRLRRAGLLSIPEERAPPPVLARANALHDAFEGEKRTGIAQFLHDPALVAAHLAMLPPPRRPRIDPIDADLVVGLARVEEAASLEAAWSALAPKERVAVLASRDGVERLAALAQG